MPLPEYQPWHSQQLYERAAHTVPHRPMVVVLVAALAGVLLDRSGVLPGTAAWCLAVLLWGVWWKCRRTHRANAAWWLLAATLAAAGVWHHGYWHLWRSDEIGRRFAGEREPVCLRGRVLTGVVRMAPPPATPLRAIPVGDRCRLTLMATEIRDGERWVPASGLCELTVDGLLPPYTRGDELQVVALAARPQPPANPGQFDYAADARAERRLCDLAATSPECVTRLTTETYGSPLVWIDRWRQAWQQRLWCELSPATAPIACELLMGLGDALPRDSAMHYMLTGSTHVLVVSGMHVTIAVGGFAVLLTWLGFPRRWLPPTVALSAMVYMLLTGANAPVVRATLMVLAALAGLSRGRSLVNFNSLAAAAIGVLIVSPCDLLRTGPQLSFLCVAALFVFAGWVDRRLGQRRDDPEYAVLRSPAAAAGMWLWYFVIVTTGVSACVWLVALPLVAHEFHLIPWVAIPLAPLLLPLATLTLAVGMIDVVLATTFPLLAGGSAIALEWSLRGFDALVLLASQLPMSHSWVAGPAAWWVVGTYAVGAMVVLGPLGGLLRWRPLLLATAVACWCLVGTLPIVARWLAPPHVEYAVLDMGHGLCQVVHTPEGKTMLCDAGSLGSPSQATEVVAGYLWSRGITRIDGVAISHADIDHYNAIPGLVDRFAVSQAFLAPGAFSLAPLDENGSAPAVLIRSLQQREIPISEVMLGDRLKIDRHTTAEVLHPTELGTAGSDNANSLVLGFESLGWRLLAPGDLESPGSDQMLRDEPWQCDVLVAPHHGSRRSDPEGFAGWCLPRWVVVSGSRDLGTYEVNRSYQAVGARVLTTQAEGCQCFWFGPNRTAKRFVGPELRPPDAT